MMVDRTVQLSRPDEVRLLLPQTQQQLAKLMTLDALFFPSKKDGPLALWDHQQRSTQSSKRPSSRTWLKGRERASRRRTGRTGRTCRCRRCGGRRRSHRIEREKAPLLPRLYMVTWGRVLAWNSKGSSPDHYVVAVRKRPSRSRIRKSFPSLLIRELRELRAAVTSRRRASSPIAVQLL